MKTRLFIPQKKLGTAVFFLEEFKRESKGVMLDEDCRAALAMTFLLDPFNFVQGRLVDSAALHSG